MTPTNNTTLFRPQEVILESSSPSQEFAKNNSQQDSFNPDSSLEDVFSFYNILSSSSPFSSLNNNNNFYMNNQQQNKTKDLIVDDNDNSAQIALDASTNDLYPEVMDDTSNQLTMANYYPQHNTTQSLPYLSESVLSPSQLALQLKDGIEELDASNKDKINNSSNKLLARLTQIPAKLKKPKLKKPSQGPKSRPAFVMKLWNMVNDPKNDEFIKWLPDGKSFIVSNRESFMKYILPKYFKHNNFASFVRQLNMYGWHKVQDVTHESIHSSGPQGNNNESWQFENVNFIRDRDDLLDDIVRNRSSKEDEDVDFGLLLNELEAIKMNQMAIVEDLRRIRGDNQLLWEENFSARERHDKQTQALDKIMRFLHQVYGNGNRIEGANNFNFGDLVQATQGPYYSQQPSQPSQPPQPSQQHLTKQDYHGTEEMFNRPRLMLTDSAHHSSFSDGPQSVPSASSIQEIPRSPKDYGKPSSTDTPQSVSSSNHHPLIQELIDNDNMQSLAPSPRALFPELAPQPPTDVAPQATTVGNNSELSLIDKLEESIQKQGESILQVNDWISKLAAGTTKNDKDQDNDEFSPSEDSMNFNVDEFLAPTPQDYLHHTNGSNLFDNNTASSYENSPATAVAAETQPSEPVNQGKRKNSSETNTHVGTIDEIVEDETPSTKKRRSRKSS